MELTKIEKLLEKYFEATTTLDEEKVLQTYFLQDEVAPHLQEHKPLFQYFSIAKEEQFTKPVPLKPRNNYIKWISVAAVAVLIFGVYFKTDIINQQDSVINDPQVAYEETMKALNLIGQNFNKGTEKIAYLGAFEETKNKLLKNK